jgi:signal transduction histidine kinase
MPLKTFLLEVVFSNCQLNFQNLSYSMRTKGKMYPFASKSPIQKAVVISIVLIIIISFSLFFYFQQETEHQIRNGIFEQYKKNQEENTRALAQHIQSDLGSIEARLQGLAYSRIIQEVELTSQDTRSIMAEYYQQISSITPIDRLFVLDKNGVSKMGIAPEGKPVYTGVNFSQREWVKETKKTLSPVFSDSFTGIDGKNKIAITYPILERNGNASRTDYRGLVGVVMPTRDLFQFYGNIHDIDSPYLAVLDGNGIQLVHPVSSLVGKPFFGNYTQTVIGYNRDLNNHIGTVVKSGKPSTITYEFKNGERLNTGYPIVLDGKPRFSVFVITPISSIYPQINDITKNERLEMFSLIAGIISSVVVLIVFLSKLNGILDKEVAKRTKELQLAYKKIRTINEQLHIQDRLQKEFIHIAAHELRTPVQSILGFSDILVRQPNNTEKQNKYATIIHKNAFRLKRLVSRILDVTQIDNNLLVLKKDTFDLTKLVSEIVHDCITRAGQVSDDFKPRMGRKVMIVDFDVDHNDKGILVTADRLRISQVISNLMDNAFEFTDNTKGKITVKIEKKEGAEQEKERKEVAISIIDTGPGIDKEVLPLLFHKFASRSSNGTGLGLYVSKKIIEAHGGQIWAHNNEDGKGATFSFNIPIGNTIHPLGGG